jgi:hypothetical protein
MNFESVKETIEFYLSTNNENKLQKCYNEILGYADDLENDKEVIFLPRNYDLIIKTMLNNLIGNSISEEYVSFAKAFSQLIYNINENTAGDYDLNLLCRTINTITDMILLMKMSIEIDRDAILAFAEMKHFRPPAFAVSQHLLHKLLGEDFSEKV